MKRSVTLFSESFSKINEELYSRNYNQKHFIAETKRKHTRTFHVQLLFKVTTESYLIYRAANKNSTTKITEQLPEELTSGECTFIKKSVNKSPIEEKLTTKNIRKQEFIALVKIFQRNK